jgi:hypothetical protein
MGYEMVAGLFCAAYMALFHLARRPRPVAAPARGRRGTYRR